MGNAGSVFRLGQNLAILLSAKGGWAVHLGNVGLMSSGTDLCLPFAKIIGDIQKHINSDEIWDGVIHPLWRSRNILALDCVLRCMIEHHPENIDFDNALMHINAYRGLIKNYPSPRLASRLAPRNGRALLYKRYYDALDKLYADDVEGSIPLFRKIAKVVPSEAPFCFGANLRNAREVDGILALDDTLEMEISLSKECDMQDPSVPTVLVSADGKYLDRFGAQFFETLQDQATGADVHFHYCGFEGDWSAWLADMRNQWHNLAFSASHSSGYGMQRPTFFACSRLLVLPRILRLTNRPVLMLDFDATLRGDPRRLATRLGQIDVGLSQTEGTSFWNRIIANFLWVAPTPAGHLFADWVSRYVHHVLRSPECAWTLDQTSLWMVKRLVERKLPDARFANLLGIVRKNGEIRDVRAELLHHKSASRTSRLERV